VTTALVRRSSLGDVVLAGAITGPLGDVVFVTQRRYHGLVRRFHGVRAVLGPEDPLPSGARVVDLHGDWRPWRAHADARVDAQRWRRHARVLFKATPADAVVERYARAAGVRPAPTPWMSPAARGDVLVIAPGAAHATKRWPYWTALARVWPGPVRAVGGPGEEALVAPIGGVCEAGFERTLEAFEGAACVVAGDTGLLHLGRALGLPVVGVFGPTTSRDGFFAPAGPDEAPALAVERELSCRPCSRYGGASCAVGDHACLRELAVETVLAACIRAAGRA
jgi:hypothetical protein